MKSMRPLASYRTLLDSMKRIRPYVPYRTKFLSFFWIMCLLIIELPPISDKKKHNPWGIGFVLPFGALQLIFSV
ncbi:hypothetical protein XELAEV_18038459mg [Xenopus laevis]|uniref:Uncharacterized protein n=1 Tax=Xenopus laevis TaxID=8355 RepID=A0A974C5U3_XENLA|nr:hypothetical protein XELAEV_18038459mg [Xenopus laevis]